MFGIQSEQGVEGMEMGQLAPQAGADATMTAGLREHLWMPAGSHSGGHVGPAPEGGPRLPSLILDITAEVALALL